MANNASKLQKFIILLSLFIVAYWLIGTLFFLFFMGSQISHDRIAIMMYLYAFLSSVSVFILRKNILLKPGKLAAFHFFITGFYIGNLTLLLMFFMEALTSGVIALQFPNIISILLSFLGMFIFSYMFGFAFLLVIPACLAGLIVSRFVSL